MTDRKQQQHLDPRPGDPAPAAPTGQGAPVAPTPPLPGAPGAGSEPDGAQLPRVYLDLFALYRFPIGRRLFALSRVAEAAKRHGVTALDTWLEHALEVDRQAHEIELEWKRTGGRPIHGPKATELNHQLDRALGALDDFLAGQVTVFGAETARGIDPPAIQSPTTRPAGWPQTGTYPQHSRIPPLSRPVASHAHATAAPDAPAAPECGWPTRRDPGSGCRRRSARSAGWAGDRSPPRRAGRAPLRGSPPPAGA